MGLEIDWSNTNLAKNIESFKPKLQAAVLMYSIKKAQDLISYMQTNRPWTDRTGEAKRRLNTFVSQPNENTIRITLAHGVYYGYYLETAHERKFSIIGPTLKLKSQEIIDELQSLLNKISVNAAKG